MNTFRRMIGYTALALSVVCLIGDVFRFIGKCFSQGASGVHTQENSRVCPLCGKALNTDARFCSGCGGELTQKT